jgi:hypothetical protein
MTSHETRHCRHINEEGTRCKGYAQVDNEYCFFHDPATKEKRAAASREGGVMRRESSLQILELPQEIADNPFQTASDIAGFMAGTLQLVCQGKIDMRTATGLTYIASVLMQAMDKATEQNEGAAGKTAVERLVVEDLLS